MELKDFIRKENIFFIAKSDKEGVMEELMAKSIALGRVRDPAAFRRALLEREELMSTGIGLGVAVPHAKIPCIDAFFIVTGLLAAPVEWDSLDGKPVRLVFLIGGPDNSQGTYLQLLAQLILVVKNETRLHRLLAARSAEEAAAAVCGGED